MAYDVITPTRFGGGELPVLPLTTILRTTPADSRDILTSIDIANGTEAAQSVSLWLIPSGGSANASTLLLPAVTIPAETSFQWRGMQVLEAGATITSGATDAGVTITVSGGNAV